MHRLTLVCGLLSLLPAARADDFATTGAILVVPADLQWVENPPASEPGRR